MFVSSKTFRAFKERIEAIFETYEEVLEDQEVYNRSYAHDINRVDGAIRQHDGILNIQRSLHSLAADIALDHGSDISALWEAVAKLEAVVYASAKPAAPVKVAKKAPVFPEPPTSSPNIASSRESKATKPVAAYNRTKKA